MKGIWGLPSLVTLIFISSSLINFGPVPSAKLQASLALVCVSLILYREKLLGFIRFNYREDLSFLALLLVLSGSSLLQPDEVLLKKITQPIYLAIYFLFYKIVLANFRLLNCSAQTLFHRYYRVNTFVFFLSLNMYLLGFFAPSVVRKIISFFNNAGTFDLGGITVGVGNFLPRLSGFSPEPSFWSAAIALNMAVFFELRYKSKFDYMLLVVNLAALIATFGKTGFIILVVMMIYLFYLNGRLSKLIVAIGLASSALVLLLNISFLYDFFMSDESIRQRLDSVIFSVWLFLEQPLIGLGFGGFENLAIGHGKDYRDIFSFHISVLVSGGIVGFVLWIMFLASFVSKAKNILLFSIVVCWVGMPAYNLPFIWILLAILKAQHAEGFLSSSYKRVEADGLNVVKL